MTETMSVSIFRNDINNKKIVIILTFLGVSVLGAIILSFVNVHYDFLELRNFYRGYMGRRLLIQEGRLTYRKHPESEPEREKTKVSRAVTPPVRLSYFTNTSLLSSLSVDKNNCYGDFLSEKQNVFIFIFYKADTQVSNREKNRSHRSQNGGFKFSMFEEVTSKYYSKDIKIRISLRLNFPFWPIRPKFWDEGGVCHK